MQVSGAQKRSAEKFLALHRRGRPFVLANSWDVVTARLFAREGFEAIGTSSFATAAQLGCRDGEEIDLHETVDLVARLTRRVELPVSADLERGYSETVEGVVRAARVVLEAGAVGLNLEDSTGRAKEPLYEVEHQCERIAAIRAMADATGFHPVLNARTDTFLLHVGDPSRRLEETVRRGRAYVEAGADCIFVPDMGDLELATMRELVDAIAAPINVIAGATTPPLATLEAIGIARVSLGPRMMRASLGLFREIAREIRDQGTFARLTANALSYEETNDLLADD